MNPEPNERNIREILLRILKVGMGWFGVTMLLGMSVIVPEYLYLNRLPDIYSGLVEGKIKLSVWTQISIGYIDFYRNFPLLFLGITILATYLVFRYKKAGLVGLLTCSAVLTICLSVGVLWPVK